MAVSVLHPVQVKEQYVKGFRSDGYTSDMLRIVYVADTGQEGDFDWLINGKRHRVHAGDLVLFNFADLRFPLLTKGSNNVRIRVLSFHPGIHTDGTALLDIYYSFAANPVIPAKTIGPLLPLFDRIFLESQESDPLSRDAAISALRLFLIDLIRINRTIVQPEAKNSTTLSHAKLLSEVTAYLRANVQQQLSIEETAAYFDVSVSTLSKLFKKLLGMHFPEYVRHLRVNRVVSILCDGRTGVLEAALEAGFGSVSGFYKAFSAITGTSPAKLLGISKNAEK